VFVVNDRNLSIAILSYSHHTLLLAKICQVAPLLTSCHIREPPNCNLLHSPCIMHAPFGEYKYFVPSAIAPPKLHRSPLWPSFISRQIRNLPTYATAAGSRPSFRIIWIHCHILRDEREVSVCPSYPCLIILLLTTEGLCATLQHEDHLW